MTAPKTRKFRAEGRGAEAENEMQPLRLCGGTGQENVHKSRHKATMEVEEEINLGGKMSTLPRRRRKRRPSATGVLGTSHVFGVSSRADMAPCWKGFVVGEGTKT